MLASNKMARGAPVRKSLRAEMIPFNLIRIMPAKGSLNRLYPPANEFIYLGGIFYVRIKNSIVFKKNSHLRYMYCPSLFA